MFRQLTQAMSGAATLSAHVMAKAIAVPVDMALWARETTSRKPPQWHSRNEVVLASPFALLRDFSAGDDDVVPTLLFRRWPGTPRASSTRRARARSSSSSRRA